MTENSCAHPAPNKRLPPVGFISEENAALLDKQVHAGLLSAFNFSPPSLANALFDWGVNLAYSPGKQIQLTQSAIDKNIKLLNYLLCAHTDLKRDACAIPLPQDRRFDDKDWKKWPYDVYHQSFLLAQDWWTEATSGVRGVSQHHSEVLPFLARQYLDMISPLNFPATNPVVMRTSKEELGANYWRGTRNFWEDLQRLIAQKAPAGLDKFKVGKNLAVTKGKVIYENNLIELIQYAPTTKKVYKEPILIVPAWIMKYYILDLSPHNSLVKYLVDQGHTVFMISWKNPDEKDANLGLEDYLNLGVMSSLAEIKKISPNEKINAAGYCLGGTLLSIAAAKMAQDHDNRLNTVTLFAAQVDFEEAGELLFFIDEAQLAYLEDAMAQKGYLEAAKMAETFYMLRSYDLIWSRLVEEYLLGNRNEMIDLMAWNADATRMPYKMHSEYLRRLFLNNDLSNGRFDIDSKPISLADIDKPLFVVSTQKDHVSPWESVFKIHLFVNTDITFVLASGGHNAGIISEPSNKSHSYQIMTHCKKDTHLSPDDWQENASKHQGSWWPQWHEWLVKKSTGTCISPKMGKAIRAAPGKYVLVR